MHSCFFDLPATFHLVDHMEQPMCSSLLWLRALGTSNLGQREAPHAGTLHELTSMAAAHDRITLISYQITPYPKHIISQLN